MKNNEPEMRVRNMVLDLDALVNAEWIRDPYLRSLNTWRDDSTPKMITLIQRGFDCGVNLYAETDTRYHRLHDRGDLDHFLLALRDQLHQQYPRRVYRKLRSIGMLRRYTLWYYGGSRRTNPLARDVIQLAKLFGWRFKWFLPYDHGKAFETALLEPGVPGAKELAKSRKNLTKVKRARSKKSAAA